MEDAPARGAAAIIFDSEGRILLVKENYDRRRWSLPGGAVEAGESDEDAAIRETAEETGLVVRIEYVVGSYGLDDGFTASAFRCSIVEGTPAVPASGEIADVGWWPTGKLPWPRSNILHYAMPDAVEGRRGVQLVGLRRIS